MGGLRAGPPLFFPFLSGCWSKAVSCSPFFQIGAVNTPGPILPRSAFSFSFFSPLEVARNPFSFLRATNSEDFDRRPIPFSLLPPPQEVVAFGSLFRHDAPAVLRQCSHFPLSSLRGRECLHGTGPFLPRIKCSPFFLSRGLAGRKAGRVRELPPFDSLSLTQENQELISRPPPPFPSFFSAIEHSRTVSAADRLFRASAPRRERDLYFLFPFLALAGDLPFLFPGRLRGDEDRSVPSRGGRGHHFFFFLSRVNVAIDDAVPFSPLPAPGGDFSGDPVCSFGGRSNAPFPSRRPVTPPAPWHVLTPPLFFR